MGPFWPQITFIFPGEKDLEYNFHIWDEICLYDQLCTAHLQERLIFRSPHLSKVLSCKKKKNDEKWNCLAFIKFFSFKYCDLYMNLNSEIYIKTLFLIFFDNFPFFCTLAVEIPAFEKSISCHILHSSDTCKYIFRMHKEYRVHLQELH